MPHNEEIDFIFNQDSEGLNEIIYDENRDLHQDIKVYFRLFRKKFSALVRKKMHKSFTNILYLTLDCPSLTPNSSRLDNPQEYITELQKQYPDYDVRMLIPIINTDADFQTTKKLFIEIDGKQQVLERTSITFNFFLQNRLQTATVYKYPKTESNIQVYGIYSPIFSQVKNVADLSKLHFHAPFIKSARITAKKLYQEGFAPDIVHVENIPYYLGSEFEPKFPSKIKILQIIKDFTQIEMTKYEAFWAALNLVDKKGMKKLCRDSYIKKYVASLFKLHNTRRFYQMRDCLNFIYKNYYKFRKYVDKGEDVEENLIFNRLNSRVSKLFPNILPEKQIYYNPMIYSLNRADYWAVISRTYYDEIFKNPFISGKMFPLLEKNKKKSTYFSCGCNLQKYERDNTRMVYQGFNHTNFRELRVNNKLTILKEFSEDRIKTNFIDPMLFKGEDVKIVGALDSFYTAPLLFAHLDTDIFACGADILFNTILKLFELHKNVQVIICMKNGMKVNFVKGWIKFLTENKYFNGRWVFIDGDIDLSKFVAGSDMILIPRRINMTNPEHFIAMHYGCVPIVSKCGILNDTIPDIFDDIANGCGFKTKDGLLSEEDSNEIFLLPLMKALNLYQNNPASWNLLIKNCMSYQANWNFEILEKYNSIYQELL